MLNYMQRRAVDLGADNKKLDLLADVRADVLGASQTLYALSRAAHDAEIAPEQLSTLADVLDFAAGALGDVIETMDAERLRA